MMPRPVLRIAELFPGHLMMNGDMGNVAVLRRRAEIAGARVEVIGLEPGDPLRSDVDIVAVGSGPAAAQLAVAHALPGLRDPLTGVAESGGAVIAVNAGLHLLGRTITHQGGTTMEGAGLFPLDTSPRDQQVVTDTFVVDTPEGRLMGIENHAARVALHDGARPLGAVVTGVGNDGASEGYRDGLVIGTHMHGPVLALNPLLADLILHGVFAKHDAEYVRSTAHERIDEVARDARLLLARRARIPVDRP
jgi:lipid II isoglutaminyl synthase (glutamine-hydrolysing)